jgi:alginate O-acetyltransferase complex protein AlgI
VVFNSLTFVVFFAFVLLLHSMPFNWTTKKVNLLIASYLFYAAWNPPFVVLLWVSTVVDWYAAQKLVHAERPAVRRAWMLLSALANLGMLAYFKYGAFLLQTFSTLVAGIGVVYKPPAFDIALPVGISFYTFATMSYTLDVYLRRAVPARSFLDYALFVTFFPHLVAGPIMRPTELVPQFEQTLETAIAGMPAEQTVWHRLTCGMTIGPRSILSGSSPFNPNRVLGSRVFGIFLGRICNINLPLTLKL